MLRQRLLAYATLGALAALPSLSLGCGSHHDSNPTPDPGGKRLYGQSDFVSGLPGGGVNSGRGETANDGASGGFTTPSATPSTSSSSSRQVEETDLYRLDASTNRLFYLNAYRGLMVFDVSDVDHPKFLGRSPIFGSPIEMVVHNGIASVVVADWYGEMDDGSPFHGSIVRSLDARDPANIKVLGEARLGGWIQDTRVVGDVLYAVSEDYGWDYGWYVDPAGPVTNTGPKVVVAAVNIANGNAIQTGYQEFPGYSGVFNVTENSILLAHSVVDPNQPYNTTGRTELQYIDISDPNGAIKLRGKATVDGQVEGWGADNGRWNLDFADGVHAHTIGCGGQYCGGADGSYILATVDFTNPDAPTTSSELNIPGSGWLPVARFDGNRMYLSPADGYYYGTGTDPGTPFQVYDLSNPAAPKLAGSTQLTGQVWIFIPQGDRVFALGNDYGTKPNYDTSQVTLRYLDVTDAANPKLLGTSAFGDGWAWTPASGTFKAFTKDQTQGLVVLPFSGWSSKDYAYHNGVQLISFNDTSITTAGSASTKGWVERGILVNGRIVSLSDLALSVVDYSDRNSPKVITELTLARNVVDARPQGSTLAELSTDWWGNDTSYSEMRIVPTTDPEEQHVLDGSQSTARIDGTDARVFRNGDLAYVVTAVHSMEPCAYPGAAPGTQCDAWTQQVQVVDLAGGKAVLKGKVALPTMQNWYGYYDWFGWYGFWYYDWFDGDDVVQVGSDALAFRRWVPNYDPNGSWDDAHTALFVVDLKNADAPALASLTITKDKNGWWGNMRAVGETLYTTHYEWIDDPANYGNGYVRYYLDQIDLTDRSHPVVGKKINVPGVLVGASQSDPTILYTLDYRWDGTNSWDELAVVQLGDDGKAYLQSVTKLDGWVGRVIVQGDTAYMSAQNYYVAGQSYVPTVALHQIDLHDPLHPVDSVSSTKGGWGWLLDVEGDRAIVTSGWGYGGIDVYKLAADQAPAYQEFVRVRGWWASSLARQGNTLYLSSGYWGVQAVDLPN